MNILSRKSKFELGLLSLYQKNKKLQERFHMIEFIKHFSIIQHNQIPEFPMQDLEIEEDILQYIQRLYADCFSDFGK